MCEKGIRGNGMGKNQIDRGYEPVTVKIYVRRTGQEFSERVMAALRGPQILAVGRESEGLISYPDEAVSVVSPMKNGVVADYDLAAKIFRYYLSKTCGTRRLFCKPSVAVCVPLELTKVERRAYEDVFYQAGARRVLLVKKTMEQALAEIPAKYGVIVGIYPQSQDGR